MIHVSLDHYVLTLRDDLPLEIQVQQAHQHLLEICDTCRREWRSWQERTRGAHPEACESPEDDVRPASSAPLHVSLAEVEAAERRLGDRRTAARLARVDLARIRRLPVAAWPRQVARARRRYRSRAFGELLLVESKAAVRTASREAVALAALVPTVISRRTGRHEPSWRRSLLVRALAHQANALRVAGDLRAADSLFFELHAQLGTLPHGDLDLVAETASLESSLRAEQGRFAWAAALLDRAGSAYRLAGDAGGRRRILIKRAILERDSGRPWRALPLLDASERYAAEENSLLGFSASTARVNALCDLDRFDEARDILRSQVDFVAHAGDDHVATIHESLQARIDLGLGRSQEAVRGFASAQERCIGLDRSYDACLAGLYLADALRAAGRFTEMRRLAASLIPMFAARGVARETFAAMRLLT